MPAWISAFWKTWLQPAFKVGEAGVRAWWPKLRAFAVALMAVVLLVAFFHARKDPTTAGPMAAHDWLMRIPLSWGTWLQVMIGWYLTVQAIDATRGAKWAFWWDAIDSDLVKAAKTLAWGVFIGLALIASAQVFSKQLGV
jgi:hypothetical protein